MIVMHIFVCGLSTCFNLALGQQMCVHPAEFVTQPLWWSAFWFSWARLQHTPSGLKYSQHFFL